MKKFIITIVAIITSLSINAQLVENFDSNDWQWTEYSADYGKAYIRNGVMHLESDTKTDLTWEEVVGTVSTHAFLPMDPTKGFTLSCEALVEKIDNNKPFGIIMDYVDDMNCIIFVLKEDWAFLFKMREGKIVGTQRNQFKLPKQKKARLNISLEYTVGELEIRVNDTQALKCRYIPIESNGFGFFAFGKAKVDFDNVNIKY
jgi:hypothetical protein